MAIQKPPRRPPSGGSGKGGGNSARRDESGLEDDITKLAIFVNNIMQQQRHWLRDWAITSKRIVELNSNNIEPKLLVTANFDTMHVLLTTKSSSPDYTDACGGTTRTMSYELNPSWGIRNSKVVGGK
jgi:hypothetical protein